MKFIKANQKAGAVSATLSAAAKEAPRPENRPKNLAEDEDIVFIRGDCVEAMRGLAAGSVDVVFADPPYNLRLSGTLRRPSGSRVDGVHHGWDQIGGGEDYDRFSARWLKEARRVLKRTGTLWVMGSYHNIYRLGAVAQNLGFWMLNDIVWIKHNPMPNFHGTRFTNAHETLLWLSYDEKASYYFNYHGMKGLNEDKQMRSDWYLSICNGKERLRAPDGAKVHPTQKPEALLYRVISASTRPGEVILDPFAGSGTTPAVAKRLGRRCIAIERDEHYLEAARARTQTIVRGEHEFCHGAEKRQKPVPFGRLLEVGMLSPGQKLTCAEGRFKAFVLSDGRIKAGDLVGSIHRVGAQLARVDSCNGWTFWHFDHDQSSRRIPIDVLRRTLRASEPAAAAPAAAAPATAAPEPSQSVSKPVRKPTKRQEAVKPEAHTEAKPRAPEPCPTEPCARESRALEPRAPARAVDSIGSTFKGASPRALTRSAANPLATLSTHPHPRALEPP